MALHDKKAQALMILIHRIVAYCQRNGIHDEEIFKNFENAKRVRNAKTDADFQQALNWIDPPLNDIKSD